MHLLHQLLVLVQLVGFAAALGGCLVQLRSRAPEINLTMLYGAAVQLVAGVALVVVDQVGGDGVNIAKTAVQAVLAVIVLVLVAVNRKFADIPPGLLRVITALIGLNAALAVLWT